MIKNTNFAGEKSDSYSEKSLLAIFNDLKQKLISNESSLTESESLYPKSINNIKDKIKKKVAKRSFRKKWIWKKYKVLLIQIYKEKSSYILLRNWKFDWHEKDNADKEEINKYSEDIDIHDYWKIITREWEVNEIIFKAHSSPGFHLKTKPTCKQIEENGYKWNNIEKSVIEFYFNCEVCQQLIKNQRKMLQYIIFLLQDQKKDL